MKLRLLMLALLPLAAFAHVGSPDIYLEGNAGAYKLFVTVRPPMVIPGVAELEVRTESPDVSQISAVPLPLSGPGAGLAPVPDKLKQSTSDKQFFTGALWMMAPGSWQVKLTATGAQGTGSLAVPVPAAALVTKHMQRGLGLLLSVLLGFLVFGAIAMAGAAVRESRVPLGLQPDEKHRTRGRGAMAIAAVIVCAVLWLGNTWWNSEAAIYSGNIYKPLKMKSTVNGSTLTLTLADPGWLNENATYVGLPVGRSVDDLVLDHDHLMHLYLIRQPGLDIVFHLHPDQVGSGVFKLALPTMPAGTYKLYADVVHSSGFPETLVGTVNIPTIKGRALAGDDAEGSARPWQQSAVHSIAFTLPDGYQMRWLDAPAFVPVKQPLDFRFELLNPQGQPATDMQFYMGMLGHAAFVKDDGSVFAHIHPNGSVSMSAFMKAQGNNASVLEMRPDMPGMKMTANLPNEVAFPYGLPTAGRYRIFVQMKHGATVETGVFDTEAK